jgi:hypothetical protein
VFAVDTMRFLAWTGHLTIRRFFGIAVGDVRDTTFGYDYSQQTSKIDPAEDQSGEGEQRVKWSRVRRLFFAGPGLNAELKVRPLLERRVDHSLE